MVVADAVAGHGEELAGERVLGQAEGLDQAALQLDHRVVLLRREQVAALVAPRQPGAVLAAEGEHQRRQQALGLQPVEQAGRIGDLRAAAQGRAPTPAPAPARPALAGAAAGLLQPRSGPGADARELARLQQPLARGVDQVVQGHRTAVGLDHLQLVLAHLAQPRAQLLDVGDRGREADEAHARGGEDQRLLPDRAALEVVQEVDLVEHRVLDVVELGGVLEDRVAQDLRGHDQDLGRRLQRDVAGQQAHVHVALLAEVAVLLVGEGLDRGGVDAAPAARHRVVDGVLGDQRLARPGGRADQHVAAGPDGLGGADLEVVEAQAAPDLGARRALRRRLVGRVRAHAGSAPRAARADPPPHA